MKEKELLRLQELKKMEQEIYARRSQLYMWN